MPWQSAPEADGGGRAGWAVVLLPLVALPIRCLLIEHTLYPVPSSIFNVGFGFGDYTRSLVESGRFQSCLTLPFMACHPHLCAASTRMPVIPMAYAALSSIVGTDANTIAIAKCCVLAVLAAAFLWAARRDLRFSWPGVALLYLLYFGLQPLKHGATLEYEEGMLVDLSLCLAVTAAYLLRPELERSHRLAMAAAAVILATIMYFAKTTALLTLLVVLLVVMSARWIGVGLKVGLAAVVMVPFALWMLHVQATSGQLHGSSSWNGENLFRGYNSGAAAIYPEITLDRAFDSTRAVLKNGTVVPLGDYTHERCFADEWQWNDHYALRARHWIESHPLEALKFDVRKAWVVLVEVRHTPQFLSATDKTPEYTPATRALLMAWMIYARLLFVGFLLGTIVRIWRGKEWQYLWVLLLLGGACAPYVLVFGWQRHVVPILVMSGTLFVLLFLTPPRRPGEPGSPRDSSDPR